MTSTAPTVPLGELREQLESVIDRLLEVDLTAAPDEALLALWHCIETSRRRLDMVEFHVINRVVEINLAFTHGCANTTAFAASLLRITRAQARARVRDAASFGARHDHYGMPLGAVFAICADAVGSGAITSQAARVIQKNIEELPDEVPAELGEFLEQQLVDHARTCDAGETAKFAQQLRYALDQDGRWRDLDTTYRRRGVTRHRRTDGSGTYTVEATCELAELIDTVLDAYAKPEPAQDGTPDPRSPGQRGHDGLAHALRDLLQSDATPSTAGTRTTVILRADADDFLRNEGVVTTGHGYAVPMQLAKSWLEPEARAILVLLDDCGAIEAYSSTHRLFTEQQRLAMLARDLGCTFPDCDRPPSWTQAHHVIDYAITHRTRVDEGALVCAEEHRAFEKMGWRSIMLDGVPAWVPPAWVDPDQAPRTNRRHQPPRAPR